MYIYLYNCIILLLFFYFKIYFMSLFIYSCNMHINLCVFGLFCLIKMALNGSPYKWQNIIHVDYAPNNQFPSFSSALTYAEPFETQPGSRGLLSGGRDCPKRKCAKRNSVNMAASVSGRNRETRTFSLLNSLSVLYPVAVIFCLTVLPVVGKRDNLRVITDGNWEDILSGEWMIELWVIAYLKLLNISMS